MATLSEKLKAMQLPGLQTRIPGETVVPEQSFSGLVKETIKGLPRATYETFSPIFQPVIERRAFDILKPVQDTEQIQQERSQTLLPTVVKEIKTQQAGEFGSTPLAATPEEFYRNKESYVDVFGAVGAMEKVGASVIKRLAKETNVKNIIDDLVKLGTKAEVAERVAPAIAKTTSEEAISKLIAKEFPDLFSRERGFVTSAKEVLPRAERIAGQYIPRSTDGLSIKARNLINTDPIQAERIALTEADENAVAIASEFLKKYADDAARLTDETQKIALYDKAADIANTIAKRLTETGRAVQAASILGRLTPEGQVRFAAREIQKYNVANPTRKIPELTGEQSKKIVEEMRVIQAMPEGDAKAIRFQELQNRIHDLIPSKWWQKAVAVWKAGLLTGLKTTGLNIFSNLSHAALEITKDIPATGADILLSLLTGKRTLTATTRGIPEGIREGAEKGWRYLKTGYDTRDIAKKLDYKRVNFKNKAVQGYVDTVFRTLGAQDQVFYYGALRRSLYNQAKAQAKNKVESDLISTANSFSKLERGAKIENPSGVISLGKNVEITRASLKHIVEESGRENIVAGIAETLSNPTKIADNSAKRAGSFLYARLNGKARATVLEVTKTPDGKHQVVSAFPMDEKSYKKLIDISGRSDVPPLDISPVESAISTAQSRTSIVADGGGKVKEDFITELALNPTDEMTAYALADAETAVFQNRTTLGRVAKAVQDIPGGEFVVPFGRTPSAVAMQVVYYSPAGVFVEIGKQIARGTFDQRLLAQAIGRSTIGTGILWTGSELYKNGLMTLDYPDNERERELWKAEGRVANSIKIGNDWRTVQSFGPAGPVMLIGGHFQQALKDGGSHTEAMISAAFGTIKSFTEQTFLKGVNDVMTAISDPQLWNVRQVTTSFISSFIPTIINDIARSIDPKERRTQDRSLLKEVANRLVSRLPAVRQGLEPQVDIVGRERSRAGNPLETMLDPTRPSADMSNPVVVELRRLADAGFKVSPTLLGDRAGYAGLTPEQNTEMWKLAGSITNEKIGALLNTPQYQGLDDEEKAKLIEKFVEKAKINARAATAIEATEGLSGEELKTKLSELKAGGLLTKDVLKKYLELR